MAARVEPNVREKLRGMGTRLLDVRCAAGPEDRPFPERHTHWSIAMVRRGEFSYRSDDAKTPHTLRPGWLLLCRVGHEFECAHERCGGDDCTSFQLPLEL